MRRPFFACLLLLLAGCAHESSLSLQRTELYFGRSTNVGGAVTEAQWQAFVAAEITPRFPAGVTVLDADGQWTDARGVLVREDSRLVILLHPPTRQDEAKIEAIRAAYVQRHSQDAVMRVDSPARVRF